MKIMCYRCNEEIEPKESLQKVREDFIQIRGDCPLCGRWIKWIPYKDSELVKSIILQAYQTYPLIRFKGENNGKGTSATSDKV